MMQTCVEVQKNCYEGRNAVSKCGTGTNYLAVQTIAGFYRIAYFVLQSMPWGEMKMTVKANLKGMFVMIPKC